MSQSQLTIQLPTSYGTLNCTVKRPTIGLNKRFRHGGREALEVNSTFNALIDKLGAAVGTLGNPPDGSDAVALKAACDDIQAQLDAQDIVMYNTVVEQVKLVLNIAGVTLADGATKPVNPPSFDDVTWDDVDPALLNSATSFFKDSISG